MEKGEDQRRREEEEQEGKEEEGERILDREEGEEGIEHWQLAYGAMGGVPVLDPMETKGEEGMAILLAMGSVPQTAKGSAVVALSQAMEGKREKGKGKGREGNLLVCWQSWGLNPGH